MKKILVLAGLILAISNVSFSKGNILKNELPKSEKEFFENSKQSDENENLNENINSNSQNENGEAPKFLIRHIYLRNTTKSEKPLVNPKKIKNIIQSYENKELDISDLRELVKKLNEEYVKKGYVTTKIFLEPNQNISDGIVKLVALEGRIEDIVIDEDTSKDKRKEFFAFTNEKNKVLNISHIDNGIDNLNRVESVNAKLNIVPGEKQGYSKVIVETEKKKPIRFNLGYDDTQKDKQKYRIGLEYDNLFGMNDNIYASYKGDIDKLRKSKKDNDDYAKSYSFGYSFPFKSWSFRFSYDNSEDNNTIIGNTSNYKMREKSKQYGVNTSKLMYRNADTKIYLNFGLDVKRNRTYLEGQRLNTQDRNMTVANVGISGLNKLFNGLTSYGLTYSQGVNGFKANRDKPYNAGTFLTPSRYVDENKYEFKKVNLYTSYYKPFYFKNQGITTRFSINGQYTNDALFSTEKFSIGSFDTAKGFPASVSGDIGFNTKFEVSYILPAERGSKIGEFLYKIRPYVEYDYGKVRNNYDEHGNKNGRIATLSSYAAGVRYYGEILTLDFGIAKPDKGKGEVNADKSRGYISVGASF